MATQTNSFEGGSSGTTITPANSGGGADTAFATVTGTATFDSAQAAHGGLAAKFVTSASTAQVRWETLGNVTQLWFRIYGYFTANPAASVRLAAIQTSAAGGCSNVNISAAGLVVMTNAAGTAVLTSTGAIPLNAWFRVEGMVICSTTVGQIELKVFLAGADNASPSETTLTSAATQVLAASADRFGVGPINSSTLTYWVDDLGFSTTGYLGPVAVAAGPAQQWESVQPGGRTWRDRYRRPQQPYGAAAPVLPPGVVAAGLASGAGAALNPAAVTAGGGLSVTGTASAGGGPTAITSLAVTNPAWTGSTTPAGRLMLLWCGAVNATTTFACTGFTAVTVAAATNISQQLLYRVTDGTEGATFTVTANAAVIYTIGAIALSGQAAAYFDPAAPSGSGQATGTPANTFTATGVTTGNAGDMLIWLATARLAAGTAVGAISPPSGYTTALAQADSGAGGTHANVDVYAATAAQGSAGATGNQAGTLGGTAGQGGALLVAITAGAPGVVLQMAAGAPSAAGFGVIAKTAGATSCRLAYSTSSSMTSPSYVAADTPDGQGYCQWAVTGLSAATRYYVQVADTPSGGTESLIGAVGACKTLPAAGTAASFTVAIASCTLKGAGTPPALNLAHADWNSYNADINIHTGDFYYTSSTSTAASTYTGLYEDIMSYDTDYGAMAAAHWGFYCRSDHEAGPDNGDSNNAWTTANIAAAQQVFPFGTLGDTVNTPVHGLYQSWVAGRVRFIMVDIRNTDRSPGLNTDNSSKTMLGATQMAWFQNQLVQPEPLKVIISDVGWMGAATTGNGEDKWWSYDTERQAIIAYIAANKGQVQNVMLWHGDSHLAGYATAAKNTWGNFPVWCAAPLAQTGGGLYTTTFSAFYNNSPNEVRQYGRISITDTGTLITAAFQGWDAVNGVAQVSVTETFATPQAGLASGAGAAQPATASTVTSGTASAGLASGTGTAQGATAAVAPAAVLPSGTGTARNPAITTAASPAVTAAAGTGTALNAAAAAAPTAALATGTGTALNAAITITVTAGLATGAGTALNATASTTTAGTATAAVATGTGAAPGATVAVTPVAVLASGAGTALNASASTAAAGTANAVVATGTGAAGAVTAGITYTAAAAAATGTGAALGAVAASAASPAATAATEVGAALSPAAAIGVNAAPATGTGAAPGATVTAAASPAVVLATGTGAALNATASTTTAGTANATAATGTGTAASATPAVGAVAAAATEAGAALNATVSTASFTNAQAGLASGTGTTLNPGLTLTANATAGLATGTGTTAATTGIGVNAATASAAGTGRNAAGQIGWVAPAGLATGTGAARNPAAILVALAQAAAATALGTALRATARTVDPFTVGTLVTATAPAAALTTAAAGLYTLTAYDQPARTPALAGLLDEAAAESLLDEASGYILSEDGT